ncbi:MAG: YceI family protein [Actinomycetota bacterium]
MSQAETAREIEGVQLPPVGTWAFDKAHTTIGFVARHMLSKVRGRFNEFDGKVVIGQGLEDSFVEIEIDAVSVETKTDMRDNHLRSGDFFDVEQHPKLTFRSREIRPTGGNTFQLVGDLTIRDVTNEVVLDAEFLGFGPGPSPDSPVLAAFTASTEVDREDWDLTWNMAVETGGFLVGKKVNLEIDTELLLQP